MRKVEELDGVFQCNLPNRELICTFEDPDTLYICLWVKNRKPEDGPIQSVKLDLATGELDICPRQ